jgi:superfamily II DNA/RNA helicase
MDERLVRLYQDLLLLEKDKIDEKGLENTADPDAFLTEQEIVEKCTARGINPKEFLSSDLLVKFSNVGYRTIHFDLIYRLIHIRNLERQNPIPLEYRIELQPEPVPDFGRYKFNEIMPQLVRNNAVSDMLISALSQSKYEGLSSHQLPIVKELLSGKSGVQTAAVVAPTASGKTLAFFIPIIIKAVEKTMENKEGLSSILVYPRKALERDQLQSFLSIIDLLNAQLKDRRITIGIDDGDTKTIDKIQPNDTYREMECISCGGALLIEKSENSTTVKCGKCQKRYDYIFASKDEIWQKKPKILITNVHTIYRRLITPGIINMFTGVDYVVFDETHVYTDYIGGHVFYITRLLKHVTRLSGAKPYFVFSSATIPNPKEFVAMLASVDPNELFYVDYKKALETAPNIGQRIMLYLYLLPHPDVSIETLTEALVLAVTLWCHKHRFKAITFIDSIAEVSTLSDYIHTTILGRRQGREVTDHLFGTVNAPENHYSWFPFAPRDKACDFDTFRRFVTNEYKRSIDIHYGQLSLSQRARVEYEFRHGTLRLLLSTSTLELGIDLSDVAAIIQHKLPITPEGVVQRVGRSGRNPACLRVALGIIALQSSPLGTLYMFDERLRGRLADVALLPPARIGQASASIKLQHTLSLLLVKRAIEGKPTYIARQEYLRSKQAVLKAITEIVSELDENLVAFNADVRLFDDNKAFQTQVMELKSLLGTVAGNIKNVTSEDYGQIRVRWEETLTQFEVKIDSIHQCLQQIIKLEEMFQKIEESTEKMLPVLESLKIRLQRTRTLCITLVSIARSAYRAADSGVLQRWCKEKFSDFAEVSKQVPDADQMLDKIFTPLIPLTSAKNFKLFRKRYGFGFDEMIKVVTSITTLLGSQEDEGLSAFLMELPQTLKFLQSVNLSELTLYESMKRIENEIRIRPWGIDIFEAINLLLLNKAKFSLMLEPPSPELKLAGVEEA